MASSSPDAGAPAGPGFSPWTWGFLETEGQPLTKDNPELAL